jgi:hypothetical protein
MAEKSEEGNGKKPQEPRWDTGPWSTRRGTQEIRDSVILRTGAQQCCAPTKTSWLECAGYVEEEEDGELEIAEEV